MVSHEEMNEYVAPRGSSFVNLFKDDPPRTVSQL